LIKLVLVLGVSLTCFALQCFSFFSDRIITVADEACDMRPLLLASVAFTSLVGSLLGYDIGVISGAIIFIEKDLDLESWQAELIVGSLNLVSAFGGLASGQLADRWGRKVNHPYDPVQC
jgi:hypothetical protein